MREHVEFIKLKFVQAKDMEGQLRSLIDGSLKSLGNTNITIDERTNQLILVTHPGNLALIKSVIDNIDIDAAPLTASEVFPLKQAKADEVVKSIDEIISGQRKGKKMMPKQQLTNLVPLIAKRLYQRTNLLILLVVKQTQMPHYNFPNLLGFQQMIGLTL